jgi:hypothetical protein
MDHGELLRGPTCPATVLGVSQLNSGKGAAAIMDIGVMAKSYPRVPPSSLRPGSSNQGREARKARDDQDRPQIIVDADYVPGTSRPISWCATSVTGWPGTSRSHSRLRCKARKGRTSRATLLQERDKLHAPANRHRRRLGLLLERGAESKGQGLNGRHHHL